MNVIDIKWRIKFVSDRNFRIRYSISGDDVIVKKLVVMENIGDIWINFIPLDKSKISLGLIDIFDG